VGAVLKQKFGITLPETNDMGWGFALCIAALIYNLITTGLYEVVSKLNDRENERTIEHDILVFSRVASDYKGTDLENFGDWLLSDHSYNSSDSSKLENFCRKAEDIENRYLKESLNASTKDMLKKATALRSFMGLKFWVFPRKQTAGDMRFCMAPHLNIDREGALHENIPEAMKQYDQLADELTEVYEDFKTSYDAFRLEIKRELGR